MNLKKVDFLSLLALVVLVGAFAWSRATLAWAQSHPLPWGMPRILLIAVSLAVILPLRDRWLTV